MTETTSPVTSDAKLCTDCGAAFGEQDDRRFKMCAVCRNPTSAPPEAPAGMDMTSPIEGTGGTEPAGITFAEPETAPVEEIKPTAAGGLEAITIEHDATVAPKPKPRDFWLCGVTDDAPNHYLTLGGINFQKTKGEVRKVGTGNPEFIDHTAVGMVHHLTKAQVDLIKEHAVGKVVRRWRKDYLGDRNQIDDTDPSNFVYLGEVWSTTGQKNKPFSPEPGDIPLGCFVFMVKVAGRDDRPTGPFPTMVKRPEGLTPA